MTDIYRPLPGQPVVATTPLLMASTFLGLKETPGTLANPAVLAMLQLDAQWPKDDQTPWCSAFVNYVCWLLHMDRSKSLRARSWLEVGRAVSLVRAEPGFDVVILKRGRGKQPGPDVIEAPGHIGFLAGFTLRNQVHVLGGNQDDMVSVKPYPVSRVLGVRRLLP